MYVQEQTATTFAANVGDVTFAKDRDDLFGELPDDDAKRVHAHAEHGLCSWGALVQLDNACGARANQSCS